VKVGILALAAGKARRFGSDKRLARLPDGRYCIEAFLDRAEASGLPVMVCLAAGDRQLADLLDVRGCRYHTCERAAEGMGGTLAEAITHIPDWDGVLVALADMPWISADTYRAVAGQLSPDGICVPVYSGRRGHPVGFGRALFGEIAALGGDSGARDLLARHPDRLDEVTVEDAAILKDIDLPQDLADHGAAQ
jgi:molybdenum cofactor cytidylyltransferase